MILLPWITNMAYPLTLFIIVLGLWYCPVVTTPPPCGFQSESQPYDRVIKGSEARIGEYPWMASIQIQKPSYPGVWWQKCGGSILTDDTILTASHCFENWYKYNKARIVIGCKDAYDDGNSRCQRFEFGPDDIIRHGKWLKKTFDNDIAILKLRTSKIKYSDDFRYPVSPICLPSKDYNWKNHVGQLTLIAGWGMTNSNSSSSVLNHVGVVIQNPQVCQDHYGARGNHFNTDMFICAAGEYGHDSCMGDSGGPMMSKDAAGERIIQVGIVSYSSGACGLGLESLGAYTNVVMYLDWIKKRINEA
jgi:secreted trypsin-like serine protease